MAISRRALLEVGGFDERLGPGTGITAGEEADLLARLEAAGWRAWTADAPVVRHIDWRDARQELENALAYERGGGAWVGAALRRGPLLTRRRIDLRLRYQLGHFRSDVSPGFALRAQLAFLSGLAAGLRLAPRRFLPPPPATVEGPAGGTDEGQDGNPHGPPDMRHALAGLPMPAVTGRRCLVLGGANRVLAAELEQRGAAGVVSAEALGELDGEAFDLVVAFGLLSGEPRPLDALARVGALCRGGHFLSVEPLRLPLAGRLRAHGALTAGAHRELVESAGFEIRNVSRIFVVHDGGVSAAGRLAQLVQRSLTGDPVPGTAHRAILAVPTRSSRRRAAPGALRRRRLR
jgi:hypothetical protein